MTTRSAQCCQLQSAAGIARRIGGFRAWEALAWATAVVLLTLRVWAQGNVGVEAGGFSTTNRDRSGRKSILKAEHAKSAGNKIDLRGLRIEMYGRDGRLDMLVEAPVCVFDRANNVASSEGALTVRTADGRLGLDGRGFRWQQEDGHLTISNSVDTVIRKALVSGKKTVLYGPPPPPGWTTASGGGSVAADVIRVRADQFDYDSETALYQGHVHATESESELQCGRLTISMKHPGGGLERIDAAQQVKIRQPDGDAEGDEAVYDVATEMVRIRGDAHWKMKQGEGWSRELDLNRKTKEVQARREVRVTLPHGSVLPPNLLAPEARTPAPPNVAAPANAGHSVVEIRSDALQYQGSVARFTGNVRAASSGTELTCRLLSVSSGATNRAVEKMTATGTVEITQGGSHLFADDAVYEAGTGLLTLTGRPHWEIEQGESQGKIRGSSGRVLVSAKTKTFRAVDSVKMNIPTQSAASLGVSFEGDEKKSAKPVVRQIQVVADEMEHQEAVTVMTGHVQVIESDSILKCGVVRLFRVRGELVEIVAEDHVRIAQGDRKAFGDTAVYWVKEGTVELTGSPWVEMPGRDIHAEALLVDRIQKTFRAKGKFYRVEVQPAALKRLTGKTAAPVP